jgi:hypothetical protein
MIHEVSERSHTCEYSVNEDVSENGISGPRTAQ